jgi:hypothetical protein
MSKLYAIKERDGTIHDEANRKEALREQKAYGGMVVTRNGDKAWKPYKPHRVFLWVFLGVQAIFIIWLIVGGATHTSPTAADIAAWCGNGKWSPLYHSYQACVSDAGSTLQAAANFGKGIGIGLIVILWVIVDFLLAVSYGIYRLARR